MTPTTPDSRHNGTTDAGNDSSADAGDRGEAATGTAGGGGRADPPMAALLASLSCGNPEALGELLPGETVLDLGSGGGIDALLSANRVGPSGKAYGLDTTDEILALARANQAQLGVTNAEFLKGRLESIPLPDASVDVVICNSAIDLSVDKQRVLAEAGRVLRPGGRLTVSDTVVRGPLAARIRRSVETWIACLAGALDEEQFRSYLADAGFDTIEVEPTRIFTFEEMSALLANCGDHAEELAQAAAGRFMSAFVHAKKSGRVV